LSIYFECSILKSFFGSKGFINYFLKTCFGAQLLRKTPEVSHNSRDLFKGTKLGNAKAGIVRRPEPLRKYIYFFIIIVFCVRASINCLNLVVLEEEEKKNNL